jgi:CHAT domain-containing protein
VGACRSAVHAGSGRDNSSLVSALRTAGADVVVGGQWELEDQVTPELFTLFYQALRSGDTPEAALARAQKGTRTLTIGRVSRWSADPELALCEL